MEHSSLIQSKLQSKLSSQRRIVCDLVASTRRCMHSRTIASRNVYDINVRQGAFRCGTCARTNFSQGVMFHEQVWNNLAHCRTSTYGHLEDVTIHRWYYLDCFGNNERERRLSNSIVAVLCLVDQRLHIENILN